MDKKKLILMGTLITTALSCSYIQTITGDVTKKSDPYSPESRRIEDILEKTIKNSSIKQIEVAKTTTNETPKQKEEIKAVKVETDGKTQMTSSKTEGTKVVEKPKTVVNNKQTTSEKPTTTKSTTEVKKTQTNQNTTVKPVATNVKIDSRFDETDQKIVNFLAEKVTENPAKIKELTISGLTQLKSQKNITMSKREFLARTYQVMRENNISSYATASRRMMSTLSK